MIISNRLYSDNVCYFQTSKYFYTKIHFVFYHFFEINDLLTWLPKHMCTYLLMLIMVIVNMETKQDTVHTNPMVLHKALLSSNHCLPWSTPAKINTHRCIDQMTFLGQIIWLEYRSIDISEKTWIKNSFLFSL